MRKIARRLAGISVFLFLLGGCSGTNYRGEGTAAGLALGGMAGYFGGRGNPAIAAAAAAGGALIGGAIGMMIEKKEGAKERRLSLAHKELKLYEECLRIIEYNADEIALNRANIYGGSPAQYAPPRKLGLCQREYPELFPPEESETQTQEGEEGEFYEE